MAGPYSVEGLIEKLDQADLEMVKRPGESDDEHREREDRAGQTYLKVFVRLVAKIAERVGA